MHGYVISLSHIFFDNSIQSFLLVSLDQISLVACIKYDFCGFIYFESLEKLLM